MDRDTRRKLMELSALPPTREETSPLAMLKLIVEKVEAGEMTCDNFSFNSYRDPGDLVRTMDGSMVERIRTDQYMTVQFVLSPGRGNAVASDDTDGGQAPTRNYAARDLIFGDDDDDLGL